MNSRNESARLGVLIPQVGVSGGVAKIFMSYRLFTPASGIIVAREMTARLFPALALGAAGAWLGAAIHTTLAVAVGYAFAFVILAYSAFGTCRVLSPDYAALVFRAPPASSSQEWYLATQPPRNPDRDAQRLWTRLVECTLRLQSLTTETRCPGAMNRARPD
ncbi:MAG: hypothetical protein ACYDBH_06675, partial [Acidobacteriaceae bacterium]